MILSVAFDEAQSPDESSGHRLHRNGRKPRFQRTPYLLAVKLLASPRFQIRAKTQTPQLLLRLATDVLTRVTLFEAATRSTRVPLLS